MKKLLISMAVLLLVFVAFNFNVLFTLNYFDDIRNSDEYLIKAFRSRPYHSINELKQLEIEYLGNVDEYRIYYVPLNSSRYAPPEESDVFTFPSESFTRVIGIKNGMLFTLGSLIHESSIDVKSLYELIHGKF